MEQEKKQELDDQQNGDEHKNTTTEIDASKKAKTKHQNKLLYKQIREQMEFYFSDSNLSKDRFIKQETSKSTDGFIDLSLFLKFNKIRTLTSELSLIVKSLKRSTVLELNEDQTKVKRTIPFVEPSQSDVDKRTVYVERLPQHVTHNILKSIFSRCGTVSYISLPKFKSTKNIKGFAFVEFEKEESTQKAIKMLNDPGTSTEEESVGKFPKSNKQLAELEVKLHKNAGVDVAAGGASENVTEKEDDKKESNKKRKLNKNNESVESVNAEPVTKERKVESEEEKMDGENGDDADSKAKKKNRRRKQSVIKAKKLARKLEIAEEATLLHLRVISKSEWLKLREDYLSKQKKNVSELKEKLKSIKEKEEAERKEAKKKAIKKERELKMEVAPVNLPDVDNGSIIKLTPKVTSNESTYELFKLTRQQFKNEKLKEFGEQIAYVDLDKNTNKIFIRCKDKTAAEGVLKKSDEFLNDFNKNLLTGNEEAEYFYKISLNRDKKQVKKQKKELRGKAKVVVKVNKVLEQEVNDVKGNGQVNKPKIHVKFDE